MFYLKYIAIMNNFLKLISSQKKSSRGFTLIELLVVIGILGILAAALIATIDPFEQLKKANDANVKNTAVEYVDANIRYFTTHNLMTWQNDTSCAGGAAPTASNLNTAGMLPCLQDLYNDGEIKAAFTTATGILSSILVTGGTDSVTACFLPTSKAGKNDQNTRYSASGTIISSCPATNAGGTSCYWCSL